VPGTFEFINEDLELNIPNERGLEASKDTRSDFVCAFVELSLFLDP
jgi:hypothetical protein